jgi:hypothetical protein
LTARDAMVVAACRSRGIAIAATLGGGYAGDAMLVARRHAAGLIAQWKVAQEYASPC